MFERYRRTGDPADREALVMRFLPLAHSLARRYACRSEPFDDLAQVAVVGLLKAVDRFHPERGCAFSSLAVPTITGEIKRYFRDRTWAMKVPRGVHDLAQATRAAELRLEGELGRAPTVAELADRLEIGVEEVLDARAAWTAHSPRSLDQARTSDEPDGEGELELVATEEPGFSVAEDSATLARLLVHLEDREREVVRLRFQEDLTQTEIGARLGYSQMHVSRLIRRAIAQMQSLVEPGPDRLPGKSMLIPM